MARLYAGQAADMIVAMRFRLIDLFKWTTVIGVCLPLAIWFVTTLASRKPPEVPGFLLGCALLSGVVYVYCA